MSGIIKNKRCKLYQINGVEDHIHILVSIHQSIAVSDFVKDIKTSTSLWIKEKHIFPGFERWGVGYGAFSYSIDAKKRLIKYIMNQEEHHKEVSYREELLLFLSKYKIDFDLHYFLD